MAVTSPAVGDPGTAFWADSVASSLTDNGWTVPTLSNSWVSFDGGTTFAVPQYRLHYGVVICHGLMKSGTVAATVFTLPAGLRPLKQSVFLVESGTTGAARVDVFPTGVVQVASYLTGGSNTNVSLEAITFFAEQ